MTIEINLPKSTSFLHLITYLFLLISCNAQDNTKQIANKLTQDEFIGDPLIYLKIKNLGKDAIPYLIDNIDKNKLGNVGYQDPYSSDLTLTFSNYVGIRAAYAVEYIISDSSKVSHQNVIVKMSFQKPIKRPLSFDDIKIIKKIYFDWWEKNQSKSIADLRKNWLANKRILTNSSYGWY